jgi:secreted Zn-dependent insulinase-like peptidase
MAQTTPHLPLQVTALINEAQRELDMRRQVYWAKVRAGQMRQTDADKRIALMQAIVKRLTVTAAL